MKRMRFGSGCGSNVLPSPQQAANKHESLLVQLCVAPLEEAIQALNTSSQGLEREEAQRRLDEFGPNELTHLKRLGFWADMLQRFRGPLVTQLLVIALVSAVIGELKSAVIVSAMILFSIGLSFILDRRSSQAVDNLGKRVQCRTLVLRDGVESEVRISEVVPGDVVLLQAGSIVPADLRLIHARISLSMSRP